MRTRRLPSGRLELTELGLGGAAAGNLYHAVGDAEVAAAVDRAWAHGIRYVDTAPHYGLGLSERRLGRLLRGRPGLVLSTKVGRLLEPDPDGAGRRDDEGFDVPATAVRVRDYSRAGVLRSLHDSLDRTGLHRVDLVLVHDPDEHVEQAVREAVPALVELREQGVVGAVGVGMNHVAPLCEIVRRTELDVVMVAGRYTLLEQPAAAELLPLAATRGTAVVVAGVYNSGLLARPRPAADARYDYLPAPTRLLERVHRLADVCDEHATTLPAAALAFALAHPAVVSVLVGAHTAAQVDEAVQRYQAPPPAPLWDALRRRGLLPDDAVAPA